MSRPVIDLNRVVRILLGDMKSTRDELVKDPRVCRRSIRGDLNGDCSTGESPAEERPGGRQIPPA